MKILIEESVLRQALECLDQLEYTSVEGFCNHYPSEAKAISAITALRSAISEAEKVQPVSLTNQEQDAMRKALLQSVEITHHARVETLKEALDASGLAGYDRQSDLAFMAAVQKFAWIVQDIKAPAAQEKSEPPFIPVMYIHPVDIGRFATGTVQRESDEQLPLFLHPAPAEFASQTVPEGWQPIETAPKDGRLILVGHETGVWVACYDAIFPSGYKPSNPWRSMLLNHDHIQRKPGKHRSSVPTHWMPLPAAPTPGDEK